MIILSTKYKIFAINPGSTSTKVALFENDNIIFNVTINHDAEILNKFSCTSEQLPYRKEIILKELKNRNIDLEDIDVFVGRGGGLVPIEGGTYTINDLLLYHSKIEYTASHPSVLGSQLAFEFASISGRKSFIVNPPCVDEFENIARISGLKGVYQGSRVHALNQKEVGIRYAKKIDSNYEDLNLIIAHIGGGISIAAHKKGKMIDASDCLYGEGPMAPTRSGALSALGVVNICYSGEYTKEEMRNRITKNGGLVELLGTSDTREVVKRIKQGDIKAKLVYDSMIYQIAKQIGAFATVLEGNVDGIILTGGIANDDYLVGNLSKMISYISSISVMPGEFEMEALASGALRVMRGEEQAKIYDGISIWTEDKIWC